MSLFHKVCEAIRAMEKSKIRLKGYIDQLLAAVLDRDPNLLEGLPRLQQNTGMRPDLLRVASLPEVVLPNYIILQLSITCIWFVVTGRTTRGKGRYVLSTKICCLTTAEDNR